MRDIKGLVCETSLLDSQEVSCLTSPHLTELLLLQFNSMLDLLVAFFFGLIFLPLL